MNESLKKLIDEAFDLEALAKAAAAKDWAGSLTDLVKAGSDLPGMINALPGVKADLEALVSGGAPAVDLVAYISTKITGESAKVQAVALAVIDLLLTLAGVEPKVQALIAAIQS